MSTANELAKIGSLLGDPARANMLALLLDGQEHAAGELAASARVTKSTASWHLANLLDGSLVVSERRGRNRNYRLASSEIARMIEAALVVAAARRRHHPHGGPDETMRNARTCYDHLAGRLGVALADGLIRDRCVVLSSDGGELTGRGTDVLTSFGLDLGAVEKRRRVYCRPCMDWTERRPHLAGALGAALSDRCIALGWVERIRGSRALKVTRVGEAGFTGQFGIKL
jgi:DNA-binding transcriptional ArsR family regulator